MTSIFKRFTLKTFIISVFIIYITIFSLELFVYLLGDSLKTRIVLGIYSIFFLGFYNFSVNALIKSLKNKK